MKYIEVKNITFSYSKQNTLFENLSVGFSLGEQIAIIGRNGSGKTSLIKLILGMLELNSGDIIIDNENIKKKSIAEVASKIGFVFQNPNIMLFTNSVEAELKLSLQRFNLDNSEIDTRINKVLNFLSISQYRKINPRKLSRGEKQKLALATVLIQEPDAIILDEPFSGIDINQRYIITSYLKQLNEQGKLIIIISHNLDLVLEHCNRIISLKDGKIIKDTSTREFFSNLENLETIGLEQTTYLKLLSKLREKGLDKSIILNNDLISYFTK